MLYTRVKVHSPTPPGRRSQGRLTDESVGTTHTPYINLLTVIAHAQQLQSDIVHG